jgi:hypothetical protein
LADALRRAVDVSCWLRRGALDRVRDGRWVSGGRGGILEDYSNECPDRMRSLNNYMTFSAYAAKIKPSDFLIDASKGILDVLVKELFPGARTPSMP